MMGKKKNGKDTWRTPKPLFELSEVFFGNFVFDLAADEHNHLCPEYYTEQDNALIMPWPKNGLLWCNPPYSLKKEFIDKASAETKDGAEVVMLLPSDTSTKWFNKLSMFADLVFLTGRVSFLNEENVPINGNPGGSVLAHFYSNSPSEEVYFWDWKADLKK